MMEIPDKRCPLCDPEQVEPQTITETTNFRLVADLRPTVAGHVLLVSRRHVACLAAVDAGQTAELEALQDEVHHFLARRYEQPSFLEHGRCGSTAHAHMHVLPLSQARLPPLIADGDRLPIESWSELRRATSGRSYLYTRFERGTGGTVSTPSAGLDLSAELARSRPPAGPALDGGRGAAEAIRARWRQEQLAAGAGPSAVVTCFLQRDGRLCLLQRSQLVDGARGLWHVVAGYLPRGSAPLQHALIEIQEETGLSASQVGLVRSGEPVRIPDRWGGPGWLVHAFLFDLLEGEPSLNWEHVALAWVRPDQLTSYRCVPWLHHVYEQLRSD